MKMFFLKYILCVILFLFLECDSSVHNDKDIVIHKAIADFLKTEQTYKRDKIFGVIYYDTIGRRSLQEIDGKNRWIRSGVCKDIIAVSIYPTYREFPQLSEDSISDKFLLPSRFHIKNKKLFYWYDESTPVTKEMMDVLKKYNLIYYLSDSIPDEVTIIEPYNNKCIDYYFCREDLTKFAKIITNEEIEYYDIPSLNCDCNSY